MLLAEMTWPAVAALSKDTPIVIPLAALEQHGHHLPVFTDSILCGEITRRAEEALRTKVLFAPLQWLGNSDHHLDFGATLSAPPRVYLDLLNGLLDNFVQQGFRRIIFVNGHGGNHVPGQQAIFEARQRYRQRNDLLFLFATYWLIGGDPRSTDPTLHQTRLGHACEYETSMVLRLRPELVGDYKSLSSVSFDDFFEPASRGWITKDRTVPGHIGDPQFAAAEKGEKLLQVYSQQIVNLLDRVIAWDGKSWNQ